MAKLFKIKKKGLRYAVSAFVLLIMIIAVAGTAFGICFGIGYGLDATGTDWWNKLVGNDDNKNVGNMFLAGVETLFVLYCIVCWL